MHNFEEYLDNIRSIFYKYLTSEEDVKDAEKDWLIKIKSELGEVEIDELYGVEVAKKIAIGKCVNKYSNYVKSILKKYLENNEDVKDVLQSCLFIMYMTLYKNKEVRNIKGYIATIARRSALHLIKERNQKFNYFEKITKEITCIAKNPIESIDRLEELEVIKNKLYLQASHSKKSLEKRNVDIFILCYFNEVSREEIADKFKIDPSRVSQICREIFEKVQNMRKEFGYD